MIVDLQALTALWFGLEAALYGVAGFLVARRHTNMTALTFVYVSVAALMSLLEAARLVGWLRVANEAAFFNAVRWLVSVFLAGVILFLARRFVNLPAKRIWLGVAGGLGGTLILLFVLLPASASVVRLLAALAAWLTFLAGALWAAWGAYRRTRPPLHKNRVAFLFPILLLSALNDVLQFAGFLGFGNLFRLGAVALLTYLLTRLYLVDVRQLVRQALAALTALGLITAAYAGVLAFQREVAWLFLPPEGRMRSFILVVVATGLAYGLYLLARRFIDRLIPIQSYNPGVTLRDYALAISNIIDVERLATVAVGLIIEAMDIRRGFLLLVDPERGPNGELVYRLRAVRGAGEKPTRVGTLNSNSPIALFFLQNRRPLLQYEIDFQSIFRQAPANEREWLKSLDVEVFAPIYAKNEWIGLLALGAKASGQRYTEDDLNVLTTIAHQTAVALENARLVDNLMRLNQEIRQAYQALDAVNRKLEHLERTKSNFISIASHELRTPLTVLRGYTEMLLEDPGIRSNPNYRQIVEGIHKGTMRLHEIMDAMFDIAQIDSRSIELHMQPVDLAELIQSTCAGFAQVVQERQQTLTVELETLPIIKADPQTLRKVIYHLVSNAIKFTPNGGKIRVMGRAVLPNQRDLPEGGVEIIVADTGVGVDPAHRELIFTKFYQPADELNRHSTGKTKFKGAGSGLGLALSRGIVEAHGGRIWVESPGYDEIHFPGSEFHVILPLRRQSESDTVRVSSAVKIRLS